MIYKDKNCEYEINAKRGRIVFYGGNKEDLLQTLDVHTCPDCKGTGEVTLLPYHGETCSWDEEQLPCPNCPGNGIIEHV